MKDKVRKTYGEGASRHTGDQDGAGNQKGGFHGFRENEWDVSGFQSRLAGFYRQKGRYQDKCRCAQHLRTLGSIMIIRWTNDPREMMIIILKYVNVIITAGLSGTIGQELTCSTPDHKGMGFTKSKSVTHI